MTWNSSELSFIKFQMIDANPSTEKIIEQCLFIFLAGKEQTVFAMRTKSVVVMKNCQYLPKLLFGISNAFTNGTASWRTSQQSWFRTFRYSFGLGAPYNFVRDTKFVFTRSIEDCKALLVQLCNQHPVCFLQPIENRSKITRSIKRKANYLWAFQTLNASKRIHARVLWPFRRLAWDLNVAFAIFKSVQMKFRIEQMFFICIANGEDGFILRN